MKRQTRDIYLIRHGHIDTGDARIFVGQSDLPLSAEGERQAERLANALGDVPMERIVTSDLKRCVATARRIVTAQQDAVLETHSDFREINLGKWEGRRFDEIRFVYADEFACRGRNIACYRPPGGESFEDLGRRVMSAFRQIVTHQKGNLALVTHVGVIRVIICNVLEMPLENLFRLHHDYGAYSVLSGNDAGTLARFNIQPPAG